MCVSKSQRRKRDESGRGRGVVKVPREDAGEGVGEGAGEDKV